MPKSLAVAAIVEVVTGIALIVVPLKVLGLLAGPGVLEHGEIIGRLAGFALLAVGGACWPGRQRALAASAAFRAMLMYNVLATPLLALLGALRYFHGPLLWPAVALHAAVASWMCWEWRRDRVARAE